MGCINSKQVARTASPSFEYAAVVKADDGSVVLRPSSRNPSTILVSDGKSEDRSNRELKKFKKDGSFSFRLGFSHRYVAAEQTAAGWPSWLCDSAGEAIHGWVPLRADSFEKMDKIGQGTYSSVFRAREVETGKIFALKKVRFDNFQPESIRFMAREIMILRRLDHPNIMKLEGIVTSRSSNSIYLVFEYMEHDLAGLVSCPDIQFSSAQVKCYMRQLLSAVEHCHLRGIMHRDIKVSNILVNNEGILKLGDFGLANILNPKNKQPLTSRVVTLWYRPPELLMGSTNYGLSVDLWSVGCVFAELYMGKPILKGRTEVEQLHKIFKLCGSPPDEYWKKAKLPPSTMFKPQNSYESSLRERCKDFPTSVVDLLETFLSIEPEKRGTASSALMSQYFRTEPYACDPSSLPKYPPQKELDAKNREDAQRKKIGGKPRDHGAPRRHRRARKTSHEPSSLDKLSEDAEDNSQLSHRNNDSNNVQTLRSRASNLRRDLTKPSLDTVSEICPSEDTFQGDSTCSRPAPISASSGFTWAKRRSNDVTSAISDGSKSQFSALDPSFAMISYNWKPLVNNELHTNCTGHDICEAAKLAMRKQQRSNFDMPISFDESDFFKSQKNQDHNYQEELIELSGPLLSQSACLDERLQKNESDIRIATRRSRFEREK